jgi:hypothetical protein
MTDTPECVKHTGQYASTRFCPRCGRGLGVWGSFRRSTFRREGCVDFRCHTETSTGRRRAKSTNPDPDSRPRPRRFGPSRRGRAWGVNFVGVSHCSVTRKKKGVGAGSLKILAGVLVHRAARPLRGSVSCGSGWSVPCVSIQLTLSQRRNIWRVHSAVFRALLIDVTPQARIERIFARHRVSRDHACTNAI